MTDKTESIASKQTVFVSKFLQNIEEIGEEDDDFEVISQTIVTQEVVVEKPMVSVAAVDIHESRGEGTETVEGEV